MRAWMTNLHQLAPQNCCILQHLLSLNLSYCPPGSQLCLLLLSCGVLRFNLLDETIRCATCMDTRWGVVRHALCMYASVVRHALCMYASGVQYACMNAGGILSMSNYFKNKFHGYCEFGSVRHACMHAGVEMCDMHACGWWWCPTYIHARVRVVWVCDMHTHTYDKK